MTTIWWIRRDFRLADNAALHNARQREETIIPLYIVDPVLIHNQRNRGPRIAFMLGGLQTLKSDIEKAGGYLIIRTGKPVEIMLDFVKEVNATSVHFNRDYSPYAHRRDHAIRTELMKIGIEIYDYKDLVIHEAHEVLMVEADRGGMVYCVNGNTHF